MGNCLRHDREDEQWGGEDWSHVITSRDERMAMKMEQEFEELIKLDDKKKRSDQRYSTTEVKVKISKKQLEKLLHGFDSHQPQQQQQQHDGLSVHHVLCQLIKSSSHYETHQRSGWRPQLQSIPEV